jgi:DNA-binding response OmpR family regulator
MVNVIVVSADAIFARVVSRSIGNLCAKRIVSSLDEATRHEGTLYVLDLRVAPAVELQRLKLLGLPDRNTIVVIPPNPMSRTQCLRAGCGIVLEDPLDPFELRSFIEGFIPQTESIIQVGNVTLKPKLLQGFLNSKELGLSPTEFRILVTLAQYSSQHVSREKIRENVWGKDFAIADRSIDSNVSRLRTKIQASTVKILSGRTKGYLLEAN